MDSVGDILLEKGCDIFAIGPEATVFQAVELMCARKVGALLVTTADATLGIISERDVMTRVILERRDPATTTVARVMTSALCYVRPDTAAREAMAIMTNQRCRHLPVVADGGVIGVVSIGDLVRHASREQEYELRALTQYVHGM